MGSVFAVLEELQRGGASDAIGKQLGLDARSTQSALSAALPTLLAALARNAARPDGAEALAGALTRDHDGSVLDDLFGAIARPRADGDGILGHVLGAARPAVEQEIGRRSGLDAAAVAKLLAVLAPLVMGALGRAQREQNLEPSALPDVLAQESQRAGSAAPGGLGPLVQMLDANADGQVGDDLVRIGGGFLRRWLAGRRQT